MSFVEKLHQQLENDEATLQALAAAGDNAQEPRAIEHSFTGPEKDHLGALGYLLEQIGLGDLELIEETDGARLELSIQAPAVWTEITRTTTLLNCLAAAYKVTYQGWGCEVR